VATKIAARVAAKAAVKADRIAAEAQKLPRQKLAPEERARRQKERDRHRVRASGRGGTPKLPPAELARRIEERARIREAGREARLTTRFWAKVDKNGPVPPHLPPPAGRCWLWTGDITAKGYGRIPEHHDGVKSWVMATHVSWFLKYGVWTAKLMCHACDNKPCINPDHLFEGDDADNQYDAQVKKLGGVLIDWPLGPNE
jgi:hypothetical protein